MLLVDTQETFETIAEEPEAEQVTPDQVLKDHPESSEYQIGIYLLYTMGCWLMKGNKSPLMRALSLEDTTKWEQAMDDRMSRLQKCVALSSAKGGYVALAEPGKEMIWMTDYLEELGKKQCEKILQVDS